VSQIKALTISRASVSKYGVVFALFILSMITYVDRTSISTAKDAIAAELILSDRAMGIIFSSFALGYALMQIPAGWLADKVGPRTVLAGTVGFWSILTALTGAAWSFASLLAIRFLFGVGEAAVFPGSARAIRNWLKPGERGRANGALFAGSRLGAAFSYPLLVWMLAVWNWRRAFFVLGIVGLTWAAAWMTWFRDLPPGEPLALPGTARGINGATTQKLSASAPLYLAMLQYLASNFTNFICLSWMFPYLRVRYQLTNGSAALYSMAPLLLGAMSQGVTGWAIDRMYISALRTWSRRIPGIVGFSLAASGLLGVTRAGSVVMAMISFSVAIFGADMTITPSWVFCADVAGKRTGGISGVMNMFGSIGAFASANAFPFLNQRTGGSSAYFSSAALLDVVGMVCWFQMRSLQDQHSTGNLYGPENGR
jgi:ACS family glucarate transporter-like MFS transporter